MDHTMEMCILSSVNENKSHGGLNDNERKRQLRITKQERIGHESTIRRTDEWNHERAKRKNRLNGSRRKTTQKEYEAIRMA